jgi:hypothetical protein
MRHCRAVELLFHLPDQSSECPQANELCAERPQTVARLGTIWFVDAQFLDHPGLLDQDYA